MRGKDTTGRFDAMYEVNSIADGVEYDLQNPVGQMCKWYVYDPELTDVDPVYDVSDYDGGRMWRRPIPLPVVGALIRQGPKYQSERGFYTVDNLSMVINSMEMYKHMPDMAYGPDAHLRDRIVYRNSLFVPTRIYPKGHIQDHIVMITVDAIEVKPEEVVNDPQFNLLHLDMDGGTLPSDGRMRSSTNGDIVSTPRSAPFDLYD